MARNYYVGWTVQELKTLLREIQEMHHTGGMITGVSSGGTSVSKSGASAGGVSLVELQTRVEYALFCADPNNYENPYTSRITRTRPSYA